MNAELFPAFGKSRLIPISHNVRDSSPGHDNHAVEYSRFECIHH